MWECHSVRKMAWRMIGRTDEWTYSPSYIDTKTHPERREDKTKNYLAKKIWFSSLPLHFFCSPEKKSNNYFRVFSVSPLILMIWPTPFPFHCQATKQKTKKNKNTNNIFLAVTFSSKQVAASESSSLSQEFAVFLLHIFCVFRLSPQHFCGFLHLFR